MCILCYLAVCINIKFTSCKYKSNTDDHDDDDNY